jgi:pimeloyl-ACP methyl ester carboxylesterase
MPESDLAAIVRGQQALALFGWKPYMHNPRLKRWLHRIDIPTLLLWGERDRVVTPEYGEGFRAAIPGARMRVIPNAGHFPHWEQPEAFADAVAQSAN